MDDLINEMHIEMKEARIERNGVFNQQKIVLNQLNIYDEHFKELLLREKKVQQQEQQEEKKTIRLNQKLMPLKIRMEEEINLNKRDWHLIIIIHGCIAGEYH